MTCCMNSQTGYQCFSTCFCHTTVGNFDVSPLKPIKKKVDSWLSITIGFQAMGKVGECVGKRTLYDRCGGWHTRYREKWAEYRDARTCLVT